MEIQLDRIYCMDCLEGMKSIPDHSVDAIICDLPYGTTDCSWDSIIPLNLLWEQYGRVLKENGSMVLFAQQPFSSVLVCSKLELFRHSQTWIKDTCANFLAARYCPSKYTEDILVFSKGNFTHNAKVKATYNPQMETTEHRSNANKRQKRTKGDCPSWSQILNRPSNANLVLYCKDKEDPYTRFPKNYVYFPTPKKREHPTQKPIELIRYLIRTYTNEGETILDNCMGSGTTAVAAIKEHRHFIGFELNEEYHRLACERVNRELAQPSIF